MVAGSSAAPTEAGPWFGSGERGGGVGALGARDASGDAGPEPFGPRGRGGGKGTGAAFPAEDAASTERAGSAWAAGTPARISAAASPEIGRASGRERG